MNGKDRILIVLTASGAPDEAIDAAVLRAKKDGAGVLALYLLSSEASKEAFDAFTDIGFIGDRPSTELSESLTRECRQRGYEALGRVQIKAMEAGVDYEPLMEEGEPAMDAAIKDAACQDTVAKILDIIIQYNVKCAVLVKRRVGRLRGFFTRSLADEVKEKAGCEVVIFVDGD